MKTYITTLLLVFWVNLSFAKGFPGVPYNCVMAEPLKTTWWETFTYRWATMLEFILFGASIVVVAVITAGAVVGIYKLFSRTRA